MCVDSSLSPDGGKGVFRRHSKTAGAGRVLYTSFHQEPGISLEQERVLELLMFEL